MPISELDKTLLSILRVRGPMSRQELIGLTDLRPNTLGDAAATLIENGVLREGDTVSNGPGRPRVPLEIDPDRRCVVGVAIEHNEVAVCRINLHGQRIGQVINSPIGGTPAHKIPALAGELLSRVMKHNPLSVGISVPGLVDSATRRILLSASIPDPTPISLDEIADLAGDRPVVIENGMHALAAQYQLTRCTELNEDLLMVLIDDSAIGAAVVMDGQPNRGCVGGANELGHMRLPDASGEPVALEKLVSTDWLHKLDGESKSKTSSMNLMQRAEIYDGTDASMQKILWYLGLGLANAVNLLRPNRLVIVSPLASHTACYNALLEHFRHYALSPIAERVRLETWEGPMPQNAEAGGFLALMQLFQPMRPRWAGRSSKTQAPLKPTIKIKTVGSSR